jgi:hypothetical protein
MNSFPLVSSCRSLSLIHGFQFLSLLSSFALSTLSNNSRAFFFASFGDWRFLERRGRYVLGVSHIIIGHSTSAIVAHNQLLLSFWFL